jgi:hypothetical protein
VECGRVERGLVPSGELTARAKDGGGIEPEWYECAQEDSWRAFRAFSFCLFVFEMGLTM